ncbi:MAG TPA: hypothetical protein VF881_01410 [Polyangiaceae bacterium]
MRDKGTREPNATMRLLRDARGVAFIEYMLLVGIVALGLIVAFKDLRRREDKVVARQAEIVRTFEIPRSSQFVGLGSAPDEEPRRSST